MSSKAYTMRELRDIVEYLRDNNAYSEVKGRKMWMEFANSKRTNRTWQSLKETFLKRILPDIHNPYYKLKSDEITSFRSGVNKVNQNKLEIEAVQNESSNNNEQNEKSGNINKNGQHNPTDETSKCAKPTSNRDSVDTLVLNTEECYNTAEDILKDLQSASDDNDKSIEQTSTTTKKLRDLIVYTDPLTPKIQEILDDFETDCSAEIEQPNKEVNSDNQNVTSENVNTVKENLENASKIQEKSVQNTVSPSRSPSLDQHILNTEDAMEILNDDRVNTKDEDKKNNNEDVAVTVETENDKSKESTLITSSQIENETNCVNEKSSESPKKSLDISIAKLNTTIATQNTVNSTTDSVIPNNQEALESIDKNRSTHDSETKNIEIKTTRKRAISRTSSSDSNVVKKKFTNKTVYKTTDTVSNVENSNEPLEEENNQLDNQYTVADKLNGDNQIEIIVSCASSTNKNIPVGEISSENDVNKKSFKRKEITETIQRDLNNIDITTQKVCEVIEIIPNESSNDSEPLLNPCLQSVSLYEEELATSDHADEKNKITKFNDVVILKSHSESDDNSKVHKVKPKKITKLSKDNLAEIFGFSGERHDIRRKRTSYSTRPHKYKRKSTGSSEWTSESDDEFVTAPRQRKRKILKPGSAKITSLEQDGGLLVVCNNKVYPIVADGKMMHGFLTYKPPSAVFEDDEMFWKKKYVEEKKRSAELVKIFDESKNPERRRSKLYSNKKTKPINISSDSDVKHDENNVHERERVEANPSKHNNVASKENSNKTVKLKFVQDNQEITLEGQWESVQPLLSEIKCIFKNEVPTSTKTMALESGSKDYDPSNDSKEKGAEAAIVSLKNANPEEVSTKLAPSGETLSKSSPIDVVDDEEVHNKVNKLEEDIFKKIEILDKSFGSDKAKDTSDIAYVTSRKRGRPKKSSLSKTKDITADNTNASESKNDNSGTEIIDNEEKLRLVPNESPMVTRRKSSSNNKTDSSESAQHQTHKKSISKDVMDYGNRKSARNTRNEIIDDDDNIRYKFPIEKRTSQRNSASRGNSEKQSKRKTVKTFKNPKYSRTVRRKHNNYCMKTSSLSIDSMDSMHDYRDSDSSPVLRGKRRRCSLPLRIYREEMLQANRNFNSNRNDILTDSSNTSSGQASHSSLNTDVYRSESYQLLMQYAKPSDKKALEKIEETGADAAESEFHQVFHVNLSPASQKIECSNFQGTKTDVGNSSNVTLPLSPEISIVNNISISKDIITNVDNYYYPTINEQQENITMNDDNIQNMSIVCGDIDVSFPLMEQELNIVDITKNVLPNHVNSRKLSTRKYHAVNNSNSQIKEVGTYSSPESLINKIYDEPSVSDTLNEKLNNLLLETVKKSKNVKKSLTNKENLTLNSRKSKNTKSLKSKRCSTPHKKESKKQSRGTITETVIDECMEFYAQKNSKSCPPSICPIYKEMQETFSNSDNELDSSVKNNVSNKGKGKKKKDIIKVKICKPKKENKKKVKTSQLSILDEENLTTLRSHCDGNDTESGIYLQGFNESIDLIHNHTDTCLHTHECLQNDSVMCTDNKVCSVSMKTAGSLQLPHYRAKKENRTVDINSIPLKPIDSFSYESQDTSISSNEKSSKVDTQDGEYIKLPQNMSISSLITEDLSDEHHTESQPSSQWFLLSEDENSNSNFKDTLNTSKCVVCIDPSEHIKRLFPVSYAIPDLSTITEASHDIDYNNICNQNGKN